MRLLSGRAGSLTTSATGAAVALLLAGATAYAQQVPTAPPGLDACRSQPAAAFSPARLSGCFYQAALRTSRAARHLVSFETRTDANPATAASFAEAAAVTSDVLASIAGQPGGITTLARITRVVIAQGPAPSAGLSNGALTVTIDPTQGAAGRPSAGQIYGAAREVLCTTTLHLIEGATPEACAAAVKDELAALHAKGLAAAAPLLVVRANGEVLRGATTATLTGGHGVATASDATLTCHSDYDSDASWRTTDIRFACSDGRTGVAKRTSSFLDQGEGTLRMSDGEVARFAFGCSTRIDDVRTCPVAPAGQSSVPAQPPRRR
jgi:hypothetical protein